MTDSKFIHLADICEPVWVEGDPLPEGLSEHNYTKMTLGANNIRRFTDKEWWHYEPYDVGFGGLGRSFGGEAYDLILGRNKKHQPGKCGCKTCAEHAAELQAAARGIPYFDWATLLAERRIDHATNTTYDFNPWCGECRHRNWSLDGVFRDHTWVQLGRPLEENSGIKRMAWRFGDLTRALGNYEDGSWHT